MDKSDLRIMKGDTHVHFGGFLAQHAVCGMSVYCIEA